MVRAHLFDTLGFALGIGPRSAVPGPNRQAGSRGGSDAVAGLLDRDEVLDSLITAWRSSAQVAAVVGITGEPGIGRTALLSAVADRVAGAGGRVLRVRGRESERHLGLAALADLLEPVIELATDPEVRDALAGLLPSAGAAVPPGTGWERRRVAAVLSVLEAARTSVSTLLMIDDAHLLDSSSGQELAYLLRRLPPGTCALVAWPNDHSGSGLPRATRELDGALLVRLPGISVEAVRQLAGGQDPVDLWQRTRGIPRLVLECLAGADPDADDDLRGMVAARLDQLSPEALQVLAGAAVVGGPAQPDLLRAVSGRDERGTVEAIEEAMSRSLMIEVGAEYDLPHATARELVLERTTQARQALLHRRAAAHLAAHATARAVHPGIVARHYTEAGLPEAAAPWHARAATLAIAARAHDEALAHLALAGDSGEVAAARGEVLVRLGRYDEAIAALEESVAAGDLGPEATATALHRLADVHDRLGEWPIALERLQSAEQALGPAHGPLRARLRTDRALSSYRLGDLGVARALAEAVTGEAADAAEEARAWNVLGMVALAGGDPEQGLGAFTRSAELAGRTDAADVAVAAWHNQSRALHLIGRGSDAMAAAEQARALAAAQGDLHRLAAIESHLADLLHAQGRTEEAEVLQTSSARALARVALPHQRPEVWLTADW